MVEKNGYNNVMMFVGMVLIDVPVIDKTGANVKSCATCHMEISDQVRMHLLSPCEISCGIKKHNTA